MVQHLGLLERLDARAASSPHGRAIIDPGGRAVTREVLARRARAIARGFSVAGLEPGDRVLFAVRPSATAVALMVGIVEAGGVLVAAQPGVGDSVFESQMRLVQPRWVVAESRVLAAMNSPLVRRVVRWRGGALPSLERLRSATFVRVGRWLPWMPRAITLEALEILAAGPHPETPRAASSTDAPALIVFTSGTTDTPKAVVHSRGSLQATLDIVGERLAIGEGDVLYARELHLALPALFAGATVIISASTRFSAAEAVRRLDVNGATHMFEVTANCRLLAEHLAARRRRLPASLRHVLIGAAPVPATFLRGFRDALPPGARAWCVYGMTEILPVAVVPLEEKIAYVGGGDLVGAPVRGVEARVSASGELLVRGRNLFTGYLGGPPVREHPTGDHARLDEGRIVLLGRGKDMIIRREHNIYPELHEPVIESIRGVRRCAMVGVYDHSIADERIVLAVETEDGCDEVAFMRALRRELRQGPARIDDDAQPDLIIFTPLPESGRSRKVDKQAVRELARSRLECALP